MNKYTSEELKFFKGSIAYFNSSITSFKLAEIDVINALTGAKEKRATLDYIGQIPFLDQIKTKNYLN